MLTAEELRMTGTNATNIALVHLWLYTNAGSKVSIYELVSKSMHIGRLLIEVNCVHSVM